jgi:ribosomal protein S27E
MGLDHPEYASTIYLLAKVHCHVTLNVTVVFSHYLLQSRHLYVTCHFCGTLIAW